MRLLIPIPDLRVFGSRQTWPAIPGLFVATRRRIAAQVSPSRHGSLHAGTGPTGSCGAALPCRSSSEMIVWGGANNNGNL